MKRSYYGLTMLLVLLIAGIYTTRYMEKCHEDVILRLEQAAEDANRGSWGQAQSGLQQAKAGWEDRWGISAALTDHEPMEQVNNLFAQLEVYAREQDPIGFCAVCAHLQESLYAIGEAHSIVWWNLA